MTQAAENISRGRIYKRGEVDYRQIEAVNFSTLKHIRRSPRHYQHALQNGFTATKSMRLGTAAHIAVLEPERFLREFCLWTERKSNGDMMPRKGDKWRAFQAANPGKMDISEAEYEQAIAMKDAIRSDRLAMKYLGHGRPEVTIEWVDAETGILCKGRPDWLTDVDGIPCLTSLKTAADLDSVAFYRQCARLGYHLQDAMYADGYEVVTGKFPRVVVVAVESKPPYDVTVDIVPTDVLEVGRSEYRDALVKLKQCRAEDYWHGRCAGTERTLTLPMWAVPDEDDNLSDLGLEM